MEECRNTVIKSHAIYSMIISKFTGNISKRTSKSTSETNRIRLGGHGALGQGSDRHRSWLGQPAVFIGRVPGCGSQGPRCKPTRGPWPPGGEYTLERLAWGYFPPYSHRYVLPDGPPDARGPLEVLVGIVLGELDSSTPRVSGTIEI